MGRGEARGESEVTAADWNVCVCGWTAGREGKKDVWSMNTWYFVLGTWHLAVAAEMERRKVGGRQ